MPRALGQAAGFGNSGTKINGPSRVPVGLHDASLAPDTSLIVYGSNLQFAESTCQSAI